MNNNRIEYLDSLRGIAALSVVIFHCMISFVIFHSANYNSEYQNSFIKFITESPLKILWNGTEAVLLFFVLSGFVLSISYLNGKANRYNVFLAKRFARIYIPYFIVMLISVILSMIFLEFNNLEGMSSTFNNRWNHPITLEAILAYVFMINYDTANVNGVVWTLFHEMRISIVFPLLMLVIIKYNFIKSLMINAIIVVGSWLLLGVIGLYTSGLPSFLANDFRATAFYVVFFVLGATLCKYRLEVSSYIYKMKPSSKFLLFSLSIILISARWILDTMPIFSTYTHQLVVGIGIILLFAVVLSSELSQKILMNKFLLWLGKISFSLYLTHILVLMTLAILFGKDLIWLTPIVSLPIAALTYKYVEGPAIKIGKRWTNILKGKTKVKEEAIKYM